MILHLSLQTVSLSYHRTTTTKLHKLEGQLKEIQRTMNMLCTAFLSGEMERPQKRVNHLQQWAQKERHVLRNASSIAVDVAQKKRKADTGTYILPREKKAMVEWIRWPDSSTPVYSTVSTPSHDYPTRTLKRTGSIQRVGHLDASEGDSEVSSMTEDGPFERMIRLGKEKCESGKYRRAEPALEFALTQAISRSQYTFTDDFYTYPELVQDHAKIRDILEFLFQCCNKLHHWDRVDLISQGKEYPLATRSVPVFPVGDIMAELLCERGQFEKAESLCRRITDAGRSSRRDFRYYLKSQV